jgi:hypothetical protein
MCVVSAVTDYGQKIWTDPNIFKPTIQPWQANTTPEIVNPVTVNKFPTKEEVEEFYKLLEAARQFDEKTSQADCISEDKAAWLAKFKEMVRELYGHLENEPK